MADPQALIKQVFSHLTFPDAQIEYVDNPEDITLKVEVPEDSSGILIGYRGEKINAIQLILSLMLNQHSIAFRHVHLDINRYRERRHDSLKEMADSAAQSAIESGREILLPPLPGYERRLVHLHLQDNPRVETYSEGEPPQRRLVVRPKLDQKHD